MADLDIGLLGKSQVTMFKPFRELPDTIGISRKSDLDTDKRRKRGFLQVETGSACFAIGRVTCTTGGKSITWYQTIYRGDVYRFLAEF